MLRRHEPFARNLDKLLIRYPRMGRESQFIKCLQAEAEERVVIVFEDRLEGLPLD